MTKETEAFVNGILTGAAVTALAFVLCIWSPKADAAEFYSITGTRGGVTILHGDTGSAAARIIKRRADLSDEAAERASRWEDYCQPKTVRGEWGVEKYVYAHEGCEFGRDHD